MPLTYATPADFESWTGAPAPQGVNLGRLLESASMRVRGATARAVYRVYPSGAPSDDDVADAFRSATCAQAAAWIDLGYDPAQPNRPRPDEDRPVQSESLNGATLQYADTAQTVAAQAEVRERLAPLAWEYLYDAGLIGGRAWVTG